MIDIRKVCSDEIEQAAALVPAGYAEPDWDRVYVITQDDVIVGLMSAETRLVLEPLYVDQSLPVETRRDIVDKALCWMDGMLREVAARLGLPRWSAFISDEHAALQRHVERRMPVTWAREKPGKWYHRNYMR